MTSYHQHFDRLGNQVPPPEPDWQHKLLQAASFVTALACLFILIWVR